MAEDSDRQAGAESAGGDGGAAGEASAPGRALHARSFKLRFAAQREQGRSYVSLVKPLGLRKLLLLLGFGIIGLYEQFLYVYYL